jgi:hypothetical protein
MKTKLLLILGMLLTTLASSHAQTNFTKVTNGPIVTDLGNWAGCAWGDFRNTGFQDLVVANYSPGTNACHQNYGDGTEMLSDGIALKISLHVGKKTTPQPQTKAKNL